jgi:oligopeptide/dipeptide ABC transporter ATP-binding protein
MTVGEIVGEPLLENGLARGALLRERVWDLLDRVGLDPAHADRYPNAFSGGQRQRIGIARALAASPAFIVADEPVSALDLSVQAQILNLLLELQKTTGVACLFVSHDLSVVRHISDRIAVMYLGGIVECAAAENLFASPRHPYTRALLSAMPSDLRGGPRGRIVLRGEPPDPARRPAGCPFHPRCSHAEDRCRREKPALSAAGPGHWAACHLADKLSEGGRP